MSQFENFMEAVKDGAKDLAVELLGGLRDAALEDAENFLEKTKDDLKRYTSMLAQGQLTRQDFDDLVMAKKSLAEIHALRQAGVTLTKLERFRTELIDLVVDKAFATFL
jgi:hypothetical protein